MKYLYFLLALVCCQIGFAQHTTSHLQGVDILSYKNSICLTDDNNEIKGTSNIEFTLEKGKSFFLDLESFNDGTGKGMKVVSVKSNTGKKIKFDQKGHQLWIHLKKESSEKQTVLIRYQGIPSDGLVIGKNKFKNRTFFGDNWPNRAHLWFPCIDHPSEKALVEFEVTAPCKYKVISNGLQTNSTREAKCSHCTTNFESKHPLPTKVMVIGVADFAIDTLSSNKNYEITSWVYPENEEAGFYDLAMADSILSFFERKIGAYPFDKLANVQSTTRFGGMENASCIFYDENAIDGKRSMERLIAHEIAHQWFGNCASEEDWKHLWLSEGFATYLTLCYVQEKYGNEKMVESLKKDKARIISFNKKNPRPVIDTTSNYISLLNANSYQKGSWFLHMLRQKVGEDYFWSGLQAYFSKYKYSNASTTDFKKVMEVISGEHLDQFFDEWLNNDNHLKLDISVKQTKEKSYSIKVNQLQNQFINSELEVEFEMQNGTKKSLLLNLNQKETKIDLDLDSKLKTIELDPNCILLFESRLSLP